MTRALFFLLIVLMSLPAVAQKPGAARVKPFDQKTDYKQPGADMPPLKVKIFHDTAARIISKATTQKYLTNSDLDNKNSVLFMMFNPTCSHCMDETSMIEKNISAFNDTKIVLVASPVMGPYLADFYHTMHLAQYPAITLGLDSANFITELFLYQALPQINIYNKDHKLVKSMTGESSLDSLQKYLH